MRPFTLAATVIVLAIGTVGPAEAGLFLGKPVQLDYLFPDTTTSIRTQTAVVGPGIEFDIPGDPNTNIHFIVDLDDHTITNVLPGDYSSLFYAPAAFNGFVISDYTGSIDAFTQVTIDAATNVVGFDLSRVNFDADHIYVNLQSLIVTPTSIIEVDVNPTAVPEPSSLMIAGTAAFAGLGLWARGRRAWSRSSLRRSGREVLIKP
jgi:PEP-CTERM motif